MFKLIASFGFNKCSLGGCRQRQRAGIHSLEILASASILTVLISLFSTLSIRIQRLARDTQRDQTTLHELANLLESEIQKHSSEIKSPNGDDTLPPESKPVIGTNSELAPPPESDRELSPGPILATLWPRGKVTIHRDRDMLGDRITVCLRKDSEHIDALPVYLTGWLPAQPGELP